MLYLLRIERDGHFRGGEPIKPWVARIGGPHPKWGIVRTFVDPMNDWKDARRAWSGNTYGVVATFPLRDGNIYEVGQCFGSSSKRHFERRFYSVADGRKHRVSPEDVLDTIGGGVGVSISVAEDPASSAARVTGLGTPVHLGWIVEDGKRLYRLRPGLFEIVSAGVRRFGVVSADGVQYVTEQEALAWLRH